MSRSPLAYPLNRGADMDVGGAADLQTDIMRFMAILSLCLVAIFALVQSMPMTPQEIPVQTSQSPATIEAAIVRDVLTEKPSAPEPERAPEPEPVKAAIPEPGPQPVESVQLTRPKWVPRLATVTENASPTMAARAEPPPVAPSPEPQVGFTLRFESDAALMRLVAASQIGVYAIAGDRAQRMSVSESRISFWDASVPAQFHEMEISTVPAIVVDALQRTGTGASDLQWGVTLPGKLRTQLDGLMQQHQGGALVIGANGAIQREAI
ncbi:MAG: hypothetical protein K0U72_16575 [Gammaproteobacteria bacterium]|nr:hypothetical protein [Gammaproteobacteria bacterium]